MSLLSKNLNEQDIVESGQEMVDSELSRIGELYLQIRSNLVDRAEALSGNEEMQAWVADIADGNDTEAIFTARKNVLEKFASLPNRPNESTEVFLNNGTLIGWSGQSFGIKTEIKDSFPSDIFVEKGESNEAFRYQSPIVFEGELVGRVFTSRFIRIKRSKNSGAGSGYSLKSEWEDPSLLELDLVLGPKANVRLSGQPSFLELKKLDGNSLGFIAANPPSENSVILRSSEKWDQLVTFFAALLFLFLGLCLYWWLSDKIEGFKSPDLGISIACLISGFLLIRWFLQALDLPSRWFVSADSVVQNEFISFDSAGLISKFFHQIGDAFLSSILILLAAILTWNLSRLKSKQYLKEVITGLEKWKMLGARILGTSLILWAYSRIMSTLVSNSNVDLLDWSGIVSEWGVMLVYASLLALTLSMIILVSLISGIQGLIRKVSTDEMIVIVLGTFFVLCFLELVNAQWSLGNYWLPFGLALIGPASAWYWQKRNLTRYRTLIVRTILLLIVFSSFVLYPFVFLNKDQQRFDLMKRTASQYAEFQRNDFEIRLANSLELLQSDAALSERFTKAFASSNLLPEDLSYLEFLLSETGGENLSLVLLDSTRNAVYSEGPYADALSTDAVVGNFFAISDQNRIVRVVSLSENDTLGTTSTFEDDIQLDAGLTSIFSPGTRNVQAFVIAGYERKQDLELSEYVGGKLKKSQSGFFEARILDPEIQKTLQREDEIWRQEEISGQIYLAYYRKFSSQDIKTAGSILNLNQPRVVSVRSRQTSPYDHLYFLLRIAVSGLIIGIPIYLIGLAFRFRSQDSEYVTKQFGDKVLDYFVAVGIVTVFLGGLFGQQVINRENVGAIESRLERRISRLEGAISKQAQDISEFQLLNKIDVDSLADQLQLELNVYKGPELFYTTDPNNDLLNIVDNRLPIAAFEDIFTKEYDVAFAEVATLNETSYTMGYRAYRDDDGYPATIIGILTIPEQKRIREERARTTAYVYGALLLLLVIIMATASVLSNAVSKPIRKLREGLNEVAQGRFQQPIPVESKDELGDLVHTFNTMQEQLSESRELLAKQEREVAWSEMARQVAHEIKNPLTPMKLSVQHLQRRMGSDPQVDEDQRKSIKKITGNLIEQIDTLARIANEFSRFGRMPKRNLEQVDINQIILEAVGVYAEDKSLNIEHDLTGGSNIVLCDREETRRIFLNLIKNAKQAMEEGGTVRLHSEHLATEDGQMVQVSISDEGAGIPEELREKIFQPNFSTKTSGMGLGLAIVNRSIQEMGGSIHFVSSVDPEDHGTTFTIMLPRAKVD